LYLSKLCLGARVGIFTKHFVFLRNLSNYMNQGHTNEQQGQNQSAQNPVKKQYQPPKVTPHGGLAELVQTFPGVGHDGSSFHDCTLS
jgi:hypothetical protein